jgi:hypothetical protein
MLIAALSLVAVLQLGCEESSGQNNEADRFFLGLWEGIDPLDGSTVLASFTNLDKDNTIEIAWTESLFTLCEGAGGLITGTGPVDENGVLNADEMFTCFDPDDTLEGKGRYEPVKDDGIIIVTSPVNPELPPIILHRISSSM